MGFGVWPFAKECSFAIESRTTVASLFPRTRARHAQLPQSRFVLDREIVIYVGKQLSFYDLIMRIHPAASEFAGFL